MSEEELEMLAKVVALNPFNKNSVRQTKDLLAEGLIDEWKVRHMVRYRPELDAVAHKYYRYLENESYRAERFQQRAKSHLNRDYWIQVDDMDRGRNV